jgi:transposase
MNDVNRLRILQDVIDRRLTTRLAATRLEISDRHCRRLLERYREHGPLSLVNRRRGKPGNRQLMPGLAERALRIIRERYADFGPTLACEKLAEVHGLYLAKETVRKLMTQAGLWIPRKLRPPRVHQPRPRRACTGELIQIDGCEHRWFEDRGPACTLLVYVDDATSRLLERYGKPLAFYSDKASVFRINNKQATGGDGQTQFGRAMNELNITGICAIPVLPMAVLSGLT